MAKFQPDPSLYPFKSNWVELGSGSRIHYVDEGHGPVLLLLHGNPSWSFLYRNIIPRLRGQFRCIAPDLPGFGLSDAAHGFGFTGREQAQVMVEFIDQLDLKGVGVMMQDWGGPTGLYAAQMRPERIDRLIIGNTFGWPLSDAGVRMFSGVMGGLLGRTSAILFNGVIRFFFSRGVMRKLSADEWNMYLAPFKNRNIRHRTHIFSKQLIAARAFLQEIENGLPAISNKPALILWGDSDFAFKEKERSRFRQVFPDHLDIELSGAGHFIQEDAPEAISAAITNWYGMPTSEPEVTP
ncbi:MAG: alpha/beta fold hydrolase [Paracoccaceae bacterium]|nr:alpha/beta fold hydrolase [Paracoccaceae bacterium]